MSNKELNNALEAQVETNDVPETVEVEASAVPAIDKKEFASTLSKQNPQRAKEIAMERLSKMTPEQIAALRAAKAAKAAKIEAEKAAETANEEVSVTETVVKEATAEVSNEPAVTEEVAEVPVTEKAIVEEKEVVVEPIAAVEEVTPVAKPAKEKKKKSKSRKQLISYESRQAFAGFMFVLPWFIGFLLFFAIPCFQSLQFSFSKVAVFEGYRCDFIGFENYFEILAGGATFLQALLKTLEDMAVDVPVVTIFSLFVAVLLNRKFVGRGLVRGIFFLPVIVTTGVVMTTFNSTGDANAVMEGTVNNGVMFEVANASEFLTTLGLNETLTKYMTDIADRIFSVVWDSGIQILLFLAALQSISPSLYEASDVEGATAWETFWLITFPNVAPIILVNIVFTIVDSYNDTDNRVLMEIDSLINKIFNFGGAAAASWIFFLVILALIGIIFGVYRLIVGKDN